MARFQCFVLTISVASVRAFGSGPSGGCVTQQEVVARIQSFADAVPAISSAYWDAGGTADGGPGTNSPSGPCRAAYAAATGALAAAYNYDGKVLFKPTFTTSPYTYRVELSGALSYFIGTNCLKIARL